MEKTIGIIGHDGHGKNTVVQALKDKGVDVIVVNANEIEHDEIFDLNGVKYAPIKTERRKHKHYLSKLGGILAMASILYESGESRYERKLKEGTDIVKEYGLVQNKQSKLSKWERNMVVRVFEKNYYRVL